MDGGGERKRGGYIPAISGGTGGEEGRGRPNGKRGEGEEKKGGVDFSGSSPSAGESDEEEEEGTMGDLEPGSVEKYISRPCHMKEKEGGKKGVYGEIHANRGEENI